MSNIYTAISRLESLDSHLALTLAQEAFLSSLINGRAGKEGWSNLKDALRNAKEEELSRIQDAIEREIRNTKYVNILSLQTNFEYIRLLKQLRSDFQGRKKVYKTIEKCFRTDPRKDSNNRGLIMDEIFQKTQTRYRGTVMLPICQTIDVRLGDSWSECIGYSVEWCASILLKKNPFGIDINKPSPFTPISFGSAAGRKYPDLNNMAILTEEISSAQASRGRSIENKFIVGLRIGNNAEVANDLIMVANNRPDRPLLFAFLNEIYGHMTSFCKLNDEYHFMDCNFGWVKFKNSEDFEKWFPFYLEKFGYSKSFYEFEIYQAVSVKNHHTIIREQGLIRTLVNIPFILGEFARRYINFGISLLINFIDLKLSDEDNQLWVDDVDNEPIQKMYSEEFPQQRWESRSGLSSYSKVAALLDLPLDEVVSAGSRAAAHPERFQRPLSAGSSADWPTLAESEYKFDHAPESIRPAWVG